ncbi:hypothetical protein HMPREF0083_01341 [Aneurinibacillus aneurinilyticus ATCC 12856]|jgi:hypothetical protein|uniref:Uncharacterized protein n=1 Tax=Aneurinibacillus aneurinilyticus ATCC 12856 TaxID=649747 RepID=U1YIE0_ANEAE|nr:hypothetical protein HMPREF0083_01341 [Aneurinibacillus aneurinilyticus ATCC 12856]
MQTKHEKGRNTSLYKKSLKRKTNSAKVRISNKAKESEKR